jgi:lipoprotein-anchoring transpeptidase ErfK/SrfK
MTRLRSLIVAGVGLGFATAGLAASATAPTGNVSPDGQVLQSQVLLDRLGFGPGVIDGREGTSYKLALQGFQEARGLPQTGILDDATRQALSAYASTPGTIQLTLQPADLSGPFVGPIPKDPAAQAKLPTMGYSDPLEALAERFHTTKQTLVALNSPDTPVKAGQAITVPNVIPANESYPDTLRPDWRATLASLSISSDQPKAARVQVVKHRGVLRVLDDEGKLLAQFPATMGSSHDPLPIGHWKIQGTSYLPKYHYNPKLFWDAPKSGEKKVLQPGPNGPTGVVWMDLNKPHYGIHGTPSPETIGRAESHGCVRLTNWDAARVSMMVKPGTPADFVK